MLRRPLSDKPLLKPSLLRSADTSAGQAHSLLRTHLRRISLLTPIPVPSTLLRDYLTPDSVAEQIDDANTKIERFYLDQETIIENFVVSDFYLFDSALRWIEQEELPPGNRFLEWGSGFGVATLIAASQRWRALGIEIDPSLMHQSCLLADHWNQDAEFACGSFLPAGAEELLEYAEDADHLALGGVDGYDELGIALDDIDLVYVFPWPGESGFIEAVFDRFANVGAMLMSYCGRDGMQLLRKESREDRPRN